MDKKNKYWIIFLALIILVLVIIFFKNPVNVSGASGDMVVEGSPAILKTPFTVLSSSGETPFKVSDDIGSGASVMVTGDNVTGNTPFAIQDGTGTILGLVKGDGTWYFIDRVVGTDIQAYDVDTAKIDVDRKWTAAQDFSGVSSSFATATDNSNPITKLTFNAQNIVDHADTTATGAELETLTANSMADALHRHSELSASDGAPDQAVFVNVNGSVGIGTTGPVTKLQLVDNTNPVFFISRLDGLLGGKTWLNTSTGDIYFDNVGDSDTYDIHFRTKTLGTPVDAMSITGDGNVGIGTVNPTARLDIIGAGDTSSTTAFAVSDSTGVVDFAVKGNGYVGIGTTAPGKALDVVGAGRFSTNLTINGAQLEFYNAFNSGNPEFHQGSSAAEKFVTQTVFNSGTQLLNYVTFSTFTVGAGADKGKYVYSVDESIILEIKDAGLKVTGSITTTDNIGIGTSNDFLTGVTAHLVLASGVSPTGSLTNAAGFYVVSGDMWVASSNGDHTQLSPHDSKTGEVYMNSYNIFTGKGLKYYPLSGLSETYTVDKFDWIADQIAKQQAEIETDAEFEDTDIMAEVSGETVFATKYKFKDNKVEKYQEITIPKIKVKTGTKKVLKAGIRFDTNNGKFYRKPAKSEYIVDLIALRAKWDSLSPFLKTAIKRP